MKQSVSRAGMALLPVLQFSGGEEWLCKVVAKITVEGLVFFSFFFGGGGSVPVDIVLQLNAHLYN